VGSKLMVVVESRLSSAQTYPIAQTYPSAGISSPRFSLHLLQMIKTDAGF
jgi:hypothetical protein